MSSMSESLLLQAQSMRLEGELDTSVDLLRVVLSQCNSDLRGKDEEGEAGRTDESSQQQHQQESGVATTRRLRNVAAYQLALLLLQRSGRETYAHGNNSTHGNSSNKSDSDENEADELLWKLGYRIRLSNRAFGYPLRSCCHRRGDNISSPTVPGPMQLTRPELAVIDDALPVTLFRGLLHAFRPDSRYWSEFYCKVNGDATAEDRKNPKQQKTNQFASHNIPLPNGSTPSLPLSQHLQQFNSILEQVAIITQHKLKERFPEVLNATSVEVWSHRRPPDGQHQLHYDMDEIRLYRHRKECTKHSGKVSDEKDLQYAESKSADKDSAKRRKTSHVAADCKDHTMTYTSSNGISCPIVSCVLTIQVPGQSKACSNCGDIGNTSPPTIVCNQSIVQRNGNETNTGYLCYPRPNRLLAFEGSLLHGVVPGIPSSASDDEDGNSSDDDYYGFDEAEQKQSSGKEQRITLMMGFWKGVCLSNPDETLSAGTVGPNVPFQSISKQTWTREFNPISISDESIAQMSKENANSKAIDVVNPLWKAVNQKRSSPDDKSFGGYTLCTEANQFYGRFFLKSTEATDIDKDVLSGA